MLKPSGAEWLGDVPAHWQVDRLKWSATSCRNGIWGDEPTRGDDDIACVRVADFDRTKLIARLSNPTMRSVTAKERIGRVLRPGNLLLEKSGGGEGQPVGAVVLFSHEHPAVCSNFVARMELAVGMVPSYWRYVHAAAYATRITIRSINQTSGIQNLDQDRYFNELAPFPPEAEQTAIAAFLDRETSKIDDLVEEQRRLIGLLKEKRRAVISHAVTKGLDPKAKMKPSGAAWLGDVPDHWEVRSISSISTKITNGYVGPTREILEDDGVRYLQSLHIKGNRIVFDQPYFVTEAWSAAHSKSILDEGDVLVVQTGDIGQVAVVPREFAGSNCHALIIVAPMREKIGGEWLSWVLNSAYGRQSLLSIQTGALHPHLNCGNVKTLPVPVPPVSEQVMIVGELQRQLARLDELAGSAERAVSILQERRAALISAAVTGKIEAALVSVPVDAA
jgi:type I restriction enzyme S subunit